MTENAKPTQAADDEIDLRELFAAIWQGKWVIIGTTLLFGILSTVYAFSIPNIYKSEALLAPITDESSIGLPGQLGGLAALAGVNLRGGRGGDKTTLSLEIMKSREFIGHFVDKYELHVPLVAAKGWDMQTKKIIVNDKLYDEVTDRWVQDKFPNSKPSQQLTYNRFINMISISQDKNTGMVRLGIEHYSPIFAKELVDKLIIEINENMRQRELSEANTSISFLNEQISQTNLADAKTMLYSLIEEQTKTLMLANIRNEYVFKTIDPAIVPEKKFKPGRFGIIIVAMLIGFILSTVFISFSFSKKNNFTSGS